MITSLFPDGIVEFFFAVEFDSSAGEFTQGEFASRLDDVLLFFGEVEIHSELLVSRLSPFSPLSRLGWFCQLKDIIDFIE
jgi:hypothetical protein